MLIAREVGKARIACNVILVSESSLPKGLSRSSKRGSLTNTRQRRPLRHAA